MTFDLKLNDPDREIDYCVTVFARVREEIGGAPGVCVDLERVQIESIVCFFDKCGLECVMDYQFRRHIERYVQEKFDAEIQAACQERYRDMRLAS